MNSEKKISLVEIVIFMLMEISSDFFDIIMIFVMLGGLGYSLGMIIGHPFTFAWDAIKAVGQSVLHIVGITTSSGVEEFATKYFTGFILFLFLPIVNIFFKIFLFFIKAFWLIMFKHEFSLATAIILGGAILEMIPVINILPIGSITLGIGIYMINHPKLVKIAEEATEAALAVATGGVSEVVVVAKEVAKAAAKAAVKETAKQKLQERFA